MTHPGLWWGNRLVAHVCVRRGWKLGVLSLQPYKHILSSLSFTAIMSPCRLNDILVLFFVLVIIFPLKHVGCSIIRVKILFLWKCSDWAQLLSLNHVFIMEHVMAVPEQESQPNLHNSVLSMEGQAELSLPARYPQTLAAVNKTLTENIGRSSTQGIPPKWNCVFLWLLFEVQNITQFHRTCYVSAKVY